MHFSTMPSCLLQNSSAESEATSKILESWGKSWKILLFKNFFIFKTWRYFGYQKGRQNRLSDMFFKKSQSAVYEFKMDSNEFSHDGTMLIVTSLR